MLGGSSNDERLTRGRGVWGVVIIVVGGEGEVAGRGDREELGGRSNTWHVQSIKKRLAALQPSDDSTKAAQGGGIEGRTVAMHHACSASRRRCSEGGGTRAPTVSGEGAKESALWETEGAIPGLRGMGC